MKKDYKVFRQFLKAQDKLKDYSPEDKQITSFKEIEYVSNLLGLKDLDVEEMRDMRNMIVLYYDQLLNGLSHSDDLWEKYWQGMMSVTSVIDYVSHGETA